MAISSKVDLCNMALSHLGNYGSVTNIDTPSNAKEITFALWYDITRQTLLKMTMPNFALSRRVVSQVSVAPVFGYGYAYEYPSDCLKVLGIGNVAEKLNDYSIEANQIITDQDYEEGLELRFIKDITDVNQMSPEFKMLLPWVLAANVCMDITQDAAKKQMIEGLLPSKMSAMSGLNAQENRPIRINYSRFKAARFSSFPDYQEKK